MSRDVVLLVETFRLQGLLTFIRQLIAVNLATAARGSHKVDGVDPIPLFVFSFKLSKIHVYRDNLLNVVWCRVYSMVMQEI